MLKARIHAFDCDDIPHFQTWVPRAPAEVYVPLTLYIGPDDSPAADLFDIVVATAQGMQGMPRGRKDKVLIVRDYDWPQIEATLRSWVDNVTGVSWPQITDVLRKKFHWEFEGMGDGR